MINNGQHFLVAFSPQAAQRLGVRQVGTVWPSQFDQFMTNKLASLADSVYLIEIRGRAIYSVKAIKDRKPSLKLNIDLSNVHQYDADELIKVLENY